MGGGNWIVYTVGAISVALGLFIYFNPKEVFEIQRRFYAFINWRIEPISLSKEIRNTKAMGLFLVVFSVAACVYAFLN